MWDVKGKTAIVTGSNTGIGKVTALELARSGAKVVLACRTESKALPVVAELKEQTGNDAIEFMRLDLGSLDDVRAFGEAWSKRDETIDLLVNNAGLVTPGLTKDGFEMCFGVNHLGHFLLTALLMPYLERAEHARIVNVASRAHYRINELDFEAVQRDTGSVTAFEAYCASKLANVLFTRELARLLGESSHVHVYSLHPGVVASDIWRRIPKPFRFLSKYFMITNEEGAQTSLHCAMSESAGSETGLYYDESKPKKPSRLALDDALASELWRRSEEWVGVKFFE